MCFAGIGRCKEILRDNPSMIPSQNMVAVWLGNEVLVDWCICIYSSRCLYKKVHKYLECYRFLCNNLTTEWPYVAPNTGSYNLWGYWSLYSFVGFLHIVSSYAYRVSFFFLFLKYVFSKFQHSCFKNKVVKKISLIFISI